MNNLERERGPLGHILMREKESIYIIILKPSVLSAIDNYMI